MTLFVLKLFLHNWKLASHTLQQNKLSFLNQTSAPGTATRRVVPGTRECQFHRNRTHRRWFFFKFSAFNRDIKYSVASCPNLDIYKSNVTRSFFSNFYPSSSWSWKLLHPKTSSNSNAAQMEKALMVGGKRLDRDVQGAADWRDLNVREVFHQNLVCVIQSFSLVPFCSLEPQAKRFFFLCCSSEINVLSKHLDNSGKMFFFSLALRSWPVSGCKHSHKPLSGKSYSITDDRKVWWTSNRLFT